MRTFGQTRILHASKCLKAKPKFVTEEKSEFAKVLSTNLEGKEVEAEAMWEERDGRTTFEAFPEKIAGIWSES